MAEKLKLAAIVILALVIFLQVLKKEKQRFDWLLFGWCILFAIHLTTLNYQTVLPNIWFYLNEIIGYLHGFMLYYYVRMHLQELVSLKKFLVQLVALTLGSLILMITLGSEYWRYPLVIVSIKGLVSIVYILAVFMKLVKLKTSRKYWHLFLTISLTVLLLLPFVSALYDYTIFTANQNSLGNIGYCLFVLLLGFIGIGVEPVFVNKYPADKHSRPLKYASSGMSEDQRTSIFNLLESLIHEEQLYLYTDLNLGIVSDRLGYNANKISESINFAAKCNFNDYINQKRISAFKAKIENGEHHSKTLLALAFESGFNSKTSFNRAFKKNMNTTPSHFVRTQS